MSSGSFSMTIRVLLVVAAECAMLVIMAGAAPQRSAALDAALADPAGGAPENQAPAARVQPPALVDDRPRDYPGLHNVVAYHDGFYSGSVPEGDAGFDTIAGMGVRTIISVDGAEPDVVRAAARARSTCRLATTVLTNGANSSWCGPRATPCAKGRCTSIATTAAIAAPEPRAQSWPAWAGRRPKT
jgi:hypothetical protein